MIIWNGKDTHLPKPPAGGETQDSSMSSWYGMVDVAGRHFTRLNDSAQRSLTLLPKSHYALITDRSAYELDINLDGQTYEDLAISLDLATWTAAGSKTRGSFMSRLSHPRHDHHPMGKSWSMDRMATSMCMISRRTNR